MSQRGRSAAPRALAEAVLALKLALSAKGMSNRHKRPKGRPEKRFKDWAASASRSALRFTCQALGPQPFLVGVKRLLRRFMIAHGLLGLDPARRIARLALFGGQGFASKGKVFSHAK